MSDLVQTDVELATELSGHQKIDYVKLIEYGTHMTSCQCAGEYTCYRCRSLDALEFLTAEASALRHDLSKAAATEREACAKTVANMIGRGSVYKAIRARGEASAPASSEEAGLPADTAPPLAQQQPDTIQETEVTEDEHQRIYSNAKA